MVRSELVQQVADANRELSAKTIDRLVATVFEAIGAHLAAGGRVEIRGFGAFSTRQRDARVGRNPRTGVAVDVSAKRAVFFRPGRELRERLSSL